MAADDKQKHMEFIQNVITRHNSNSFMIKGWTITIASALFALAGAIKEPSIVLIALAPIVVFWGLDSYYLSNERCFVDLYNTMANGSIATLPDTKRLKKGFDENLTTNVKKTISVYDMNFKQFKIWKDNLWARVLISKSIIGFYLPLSGISILVFIFLFTFNSTNNKPIEVNAKINPSEVEIILKSDPPTIINNIYTEPVKKDSSILKK